MLIRETTPADLGTVLPLCESLVAGGTPQFVQVVPTASADVAECFFNVEEHVREHGGRIQYGWILWEAPGLFLAAEFHAVWAQPDGALLDITPLADGESQIAFLCDPARTYARQPVRPVYWRLSGHVAVAQYLRAVERRNEILFSTFRGQAERGRDPFDVALLSGSEEAELSRCLNQQRDLMGRLVRLQRKSAS